MLFSQLRWTGLLVAFVASFWAGSAVLAVDWFDDFNDGSATDGNPVTWLEDFGGSGSFPGVYDASSGDYLLDPDPFSPTGQMSALVPAVSFTDVYMRTQGTVFPDPNNPLNVGGNLVLTARIDPVNLTGYLVYFDVSGNLNLQILVGGGTTDIGTTFDAPFNAASEVVLELNIVGEQLSAFAWLADDPNGKPATPQVTATDNSFASGIAGIAYAEDDPETSGIYRYVAAQDTPFVDGVLGDYNNNGVVDAADYVLWRKGGPLANEVHNPGTVSQQDYTEWRARFGNGGSGSSSGNTINAVPEPTGLWLAVAGFITCVARRKRQPVSAM